MTNDKNAINDLQEKLEAAAAPDDVAGFFPWANLAGSKYRDYSASREKIRADARSRSKQEQPIAAETLAESVPPAPAREVRRVPLPSASTRTLAAVPRSQAATPGPRRLAPRKSGRSQTQNHASRWTALKGPIDPEVEGADEGSWEQQDVRLPTLALLSFAGGTGKSSLIASIGCLLAADGIRCLLVDTHVYGLLPLFFGARELSPGNSRTFASADSVPLRVMTLDTAPQEGEVDPQSQHSPAEQIAHHADRMDRILIDVSTGSTTLSREFLSLSPVWLVVLTPDMSSIVSLQGIQSMVEQMEQESGRAIDVFYLLNQFDHSQRLHRDVRERLTRQLGRSLLPFAIRRSHAVSEALAAGMTIIDYAPDAQTVEDLRDLAQWVRELEEPAVNETQGVRWENADAEADMESNRRQ